jgi:hypothetical protein
MLRVISSCTAKRSVRFRALGPYTGGALRRLADLARAPRAPSMSAAQIADRARPRPPTKSDICCLRPTSRSCAKTGGLCGLILAPGITISSSTVTCAVVSGTDAASSSRLVGSAYNPRRCRLAPQTPRPRREKHVSRQHIEEKVTRRNRANSCRLFPTGADHEWSRRDLQKKSG